MKIVNGKYFRNISLPRSLLHEINEVVTPELFYVKKTVTREGAGDRKILIYLLIYQIN